MNETCTVSGYFFIRYPLMRASDLTFELKLQLDGGILGFVMKGQTKTVLSYHWNNSN